jgi:hypothetical protein
VKSHVKLLGDPRKTPGPFGGTSKAAHGMAAKEGVLGPTH